MLLFYADPHSAAKPRTKWPENVSERKANVERFASVLSGSGMEALRQQYFMPLDGYLSRCRMLMHAGKKMLQVRLNILRLERDGQASR